MTYEVKVSQLVSSAASRQRTGVSFKHFVVGAAWVRLPLSFNGSAPEVRTMYSFTRIHCGSSLL